MRRATTLPGPGGLGDHFGAPAFESAFPALRTRHLGRAGGVGVRREPRQVRLTPAYGVSIPRPSSPDCLAADVDPGSGFEFAARCRPDDALPSANLKGGALFGSTKAEGGEGLLGPKPSASIPAAAPSGSHHPAIAAAARRRGDPVAERLETIALERLVLVGRNGRAEPYTIRHTRQARIRMAGQVGLSTIGERGVL
jgi:hypothetical protein